MLIISTLFCSRKVNRINDVHPLTPPPTKSLSHLLKTTEGLAFKTSLKA